jgi:flagellin-like protein
MNKKGLSEIVVSLILVALTVVSVVIVSVVVNNLIGEKVEKSEDCFGNFGKISIDERYTCYEDNNNRIQFAVSLGDVEIDSLLVSVSTQTETGSFTMTNVEQSISGLEYFTGAGPVKLPAKNAGKTYFYNFNERPDSIKIAPLISGTQCEVSDTVVDIDDC